MDFIDEHTVRAVLGVPLITGAGGLVGGAALVRYVVDKPFTDADEAVLTAGGRRLAPLLDLRRVLDGDATAR